MPYTSDTNKIGMRKEKVFRCGQTSGTQTTPTVLGATEALTFDRINEDKFELPIPELKSEMLHNLGGGRNGSDRVYTGYEMVEKDIPMDMQTAIWLMYGLGTCVTTGTQIPTNGTFTGVGTTTITVTAAAGSYTFADNALAGVSVTLVGATTVVTYIVSHAATSASTLILKLAAAAPATGANTCKFFGTDAGTDVVASGQGTATITLTNTCTVATNGLAGKMIIINAIKYTIISNASKSGAVLVLVLDKVTGASDNTKTLTWYSFPYTHTIAEANTLYSVVYHSEKFGSSPLNTFDLFREYYGIMCKKIVIKIERGGKVSCTATVLVSKYGETTTSGSALPITAPNRLAINQQTSFPEPLNDATAKIYTYDMLDSTASSFTYGNTPAAIDAELWNKTASFEITIENTDLKIEQVMADEFPYNILVGPRSYHIKISGYQPTTNNIYQLNNMKLHQYAGVLAFVLRLSRDKTNNLDYLQITFNSLYLKPFKDTMVNQTQKQVELDLELENATPYVDAGNTTHAVGTCAIVSLDKLPPIYYEDP